VPLGRTRPDERPRGRTRPDEPLPRERTVSAVIYARLRATDPGRWRAAATAWRQWAATAGRWVAEIGAHAARLPGMWTGLAATAATTRILRLRDGLVHFRLLCWEADQALSEFAAALTRARALLARALDTATRAGLSVGDDGTVHAPGAADHSGGRPSAAAEHPGGRPGAAAPAGPHTATAQAAALHHVAADLTAALRLAATADMAAAGRLAELTAAPLLAATADAAAAGRLGGLTATEGSVPPVGPLPPPGAVPAEISRWWDALSPAQRRELVVTEPAWLGARDGIPAAYRDLANRLLLDRHRAGLDRELAAADGRERRRLEDLREGLDDLAERLARGDGPRGYLLGLEFAGEGRAVVTLGDPDRAEHVLTHVPGMTADLASHRHELARAEAVAVRAGELTPAASTSAVMWLGYDAPDFLDEAAGQSRADAGAAGLRRFQDGLRAAHETGAAHLTVLGHSYGSLVVGSAAAAPGLQADDVVFVGSPGVGVDAARDLAVPPERVWATTSGSDAVQYAAVSAGSLLEDLALARIPVVGPAIAFARPEDDLWHGRNPADPSFGARVFASQPGAGHTGYWSPGGPALDALAGITVGRCPS
jgi:hypothetical protein